MGRAMLEQFRVPRFSRLNGFQRAEPATVVAVRLTVPLEAGEPKFPTSNFQLLASSVV